MGGFKARCEVVILLFFFVWIGLAALYGLLKPISNGCVMTYMYPQYIPISSPETMPTSKYGLYLYHEGWKKIDFSEHVRKLRGVPVLFIPGNGGSYKQVRSLASESDRAYQGGALDSTFYLEASGTLDQEGIDMNPAGFSLPSQYSSMLDWFAVDLEGEHSAMDCQILQEHTEYVVYSIHRILDQYNASRETQVRQGGSFSKSLPKSVILVGHSMGGFVARAALVHPHLRKSSVETIITLSSPHQSPPIALQPSLNHYYGEVNRAWKKGYEPHVFSRSGLHLLDPPLSHVVVVSISGGIHDYQMRTKLESLDGIVPPNHGFMISSSSMRNVWLSMEHQVIMWCNQLVVQVSHTLLSLVDPQTDQPLVDSRKRLSVFIRMFQSGVPQSSNLLKNSLTHPPSKIHVEDGKQLAGTQGHVLSPCPSNLHWGDDGLERDLYVRTATVTVLAMDGRRRWMDIRELGSNGSSNFLLVTNLQPCTGIRLHLWPEKGKLGSDLPVSQKVIEVTRKIMQIPSGPAPKQIEPGGQTEQPPPSGVLWLGPEDMHGFRFLTISVAPRPTISGRPPPAASMAVGQFFNPKDGLTELSPWVLFSSSYSAESIILEENHPLAINLSLAIGVGLLPAKISLKATGCGIKRSVLTENSGNVENSKLCKLRCFPPVALTWDVTSGLHIFPNFYSKTIIVDSSLELWGSSWGPEKPSVILLVDPHCSYTVSLSVSSTAAAGRFLLMYATEIVGFSITTIFFALMRQAHAWEHNLSVPSILSAINSNLRMPLPFASLVVLPLLIVQMFSLIMYRPGPPFLSFFCISTICYLFANGAMISLVLISRWIFYVGASIHVWIKLRFQQWEWSFSFVFFSWFINLSSSFLSLKAVKIAMLNPLLVTATVAISLVCFVHPALGLFVLLLYHALSCHRTLSSFLTVSSSHARVKDPPSSNENALSDDSCTNTPESSKSFSETQLEMFHHQHGLFILHLLALLMFIPSLVAWWQRMGMGQSFPSIVDSALSIGVILHAVCDSKPDFNFSFFPLAKIVPILEIRLSFAYMIGGYYTFISGLSQEPYKAFYPMAIIGLISLVYRIDHRRNGYNSRKHSHRH